MAKDEKSTNISSMFWEKWEEEAGIADATEGDVDDWCVEEENESVCGGRDGRGGPVVTVGAGELECAVSKVNKATTDEIHGRVIGVIDWGVLMI